MWSSLTRRQWAFDWLLTALATVVAFAQLFIPNNDGYVGGPMGLNVVLALLTTVPLAWRRVWPFAVTVVVFGAHSLVSLFGAHAVTFWGTLLPMAVGVYSAARWGSSRRSPLVLLFPVVTFALYPIHMPEFRGWEDIVFALVVLSAAWSAGHGINRLVRQRRELKEALRQLAEQQELRSRQVVLEERTRIAREMHDVVAHGVSVMVVQTGAARLELDDDVDGARTALLTVEATGRQVLGELRRTVSLLRAGDDATSTGEPSPRLADLPALVTSMRAAGLTVELHLPERVESDPGRELAVYRIVQEALTNALRHAGPTTVNVRVTADPQLEVEVSDAGPSDGGAPGVGVPGGHGLIGMRERVTMYGGQLRTEHRGRGFVVHAEFPAERSQ
ncbi:sensor histidine kinase [Plantactinospora sonchi]|uniref:histidine kinase n=1 Tax=Plantactinospora sonchi TaxID=1544735 RepID=A0ABU7RVZ4_9ACTN